MRYRWHKAASPRPRPSAHGWSAGLTGEGVLKRARPDSPALRRAFPEQGDDPSRPWATAETAGENTDAFGSTLMINTKCHGYQESYRHRDTKQRSQ